MFGKIFRKSAKLNNLECRLIEAIALEMPEKSAKILRAQVKLINKVQRLDHDQEIDFYHIDQGKPKFPDYALFTNRSEEFELAQLKVIDVESKLEFKAVVSLVKGHLFCIEFSHSPKYLYNYLNLEIQVLKLSDPT